MWWWASIAAAVPGLILLCLGLRGRRIDSHPLCRKCRFDLVGLYPGQDRCPECGTALGGGDNGIGEAGGGEHGSTANPSKAARKTIRIGHRRRLRTALVAAAVLLLASGALAGADIWGRASHFNWNTVKPVWLLLREGAGKDGPAADAALKELSRRFTADTLKPDQIQTIIEHALAQQADDKRPWRVGWGDFVESAWNNSLLSEKKMTRYARNAARLTLEVRKKVRRGDPLPAALNISWRTGSLGTMQLTAVHRGNRLGPQPFPQPVNLISTPLTTRMSFASVRIELMPIDARSFGMKAGEGGCPVDLLPGRYTLTSRWELHAELSSIPSNLSTSTSFGGVEGRPGVDREAERRTTRFAPGVPARATGPADRAVAHRAQR
jgi:hypothetical protein